MIHVRFHTDLFQLSTLLLWMLSFLLTFNFHPVFAQSPIIYNSDGTFVPAAGMTSISISAWGGGGGGGNGSDKQAGGGGGGFSNGNVVVNSSKTYVVDIGSGGARGQFGQATLLKILAPADTLILAAGGQSGNGLNGFLGGQPINSIGVMMWAGGNGGSTAPAPSFTGGGGGGSSANVSGNGVNGGNAGSFGAPGTGDNGSYGDGGNGGAINTDGANGTAPGGGGGGDGSGSPKSASTSRGADGKMEIAYTCPIYALTSLNYSDNCVNDNPHITLNSLPANLPVGSYLIECQLSGIISSTSNYPMTVSNPGTGTITLPTMTSSGSLTATILKIKSGLGIGGAGLCQTIISSPNASITFLVKPLPALNSFSNNVFINCLNPGMQIGPNNVSGYTYQWSPSAFLSSGNIGNPVCTPPNDMNSILYTLTVSGNNVCTNTYSVLVDYNKRIPQASDGSIEYVDCSIGTEVIHCPSGGLGTYTYHWSPNSFITSPNPTSIPEMVISPSAYSGTITYSVTVTDMASGCTSLGQYPVNINTVPPNVMLTAPSNACANSTITLSANGASSYYWSPGGGSGSNYNPTISSNTTYTVTGYDASNSCSKSVSIYVPTTTCSSATLNLRAYIEGYYINSGLMTHTLYNQGQANLLNQTDTIEIELRNNSAPYLLQYTFNGILLSDGTITTTFPTITQGKEYYVVIKQRNAIETWSATPLMISANTTYDFTTDDSKAFGANQIEVEPGVFAFHSGDINQDENIDLLDAAILETDINNFIFGYNASDINGDGNVDLLDSPVVEANINQFVFSGHP